MLIKEYSEVLCDHCPYANVKLATIEEEGMLNVLLDDPRSRLRILVKNEVVNVSQVAEDLDASTLVKRSWLHKPHILRAVLERYAFFCRATSCNLFVASH